MAKSSSKKSKKPIMSDIGLQMQETIDKIKLMKGHTAAKEKIQEMDNALSMIKQAYFMGIKTAEDIASGNEDFEATDEEKSKADQVLNKLRVGWNDETSGARRERNIDKLHEAAESGDDESRVQINQNSPELQDFSTTSVSDTHDF